MDVDQHRFPHSPRSALHERCDGSIADRVSDQLPRSLKVARFRGGVRAMLFYGRLGGVKDDIGEIAPPGIPDDARR